MVRTYFQRSDIVGDHQYAVLTNIFIFFRRSISAALTASIHLNH
ncbi:hypothetical protein YPPY72_3109 [Yersinia pestis PY-72]|nr:hypothetical protein YPPY72_3109 [Yersinia pestis PY-72]